jgi:hypothetical protein
VFRVARTAYLPPSPGDVVLHVGALRDGVADGVVLGSDRAGRLKVHVRRYFIAADRRLIPKSGVSIPVNEFIDIASRAAAIVASNAQRDPGRGR